MSSGRTKQKRSIVNRGEQSNRFYALHSIVLHQILPRRRLIQLCSFEAEQFGWLPAVAPFQRHLQLQLGDPSQSICSEERLKGPDPLRVQSSISLVLITASLLLLGKTTTVPEGYMEQDDWLINAEIYKDKIMKKQDSSSPLAKIQQPTIQWTIRRCRVVPKPCHRIGDHESELFHRTDIFSLLHSPLPRDLAASDSSTTILEKHKYLAR